MAAASTLSTVSTSRRARWALGALLAGYALLALIASARQSPLVPPLPSGAEPLAWMSRTAAALGLDRPGRLDLTLLSLAVLAGLVVAFLVLVVETRGGRVSGRAVWVAAAASLFIAVAAPVLLSRDVFSYAAYGREYALHGTNPYEVPPSAFPDDPFFQVVSPEWRDTRSVYGPAFTLLSAAIAKVWSGSAGATLLAFKVVAGLAMAGAAWFASRATARWGVGQRAPLAVAVVALNPVIVVHTVGGGHNDSLVALGLAAAALLAAPAVSSGSNRWSRPAAVTAVLTLASLVKIVAAIPLLLWLWSLVRTAPPGTRLRTGARHLAVAAVVTAAVTAPLFAGWRSLTALANLASRQGWASGARLVARGAQAIGGSAAAWAVYAAFLLVVAVTVWRLERSAPDRDPGRWGRALLLFALAAPYLLPWYVAWFVPLLALMEDEALIRIGIVLGCILALTGVPAEPGGAPSLWRDMILVVHYVAAPVALALFALAVRQAVRTPVTTAPRRAFDRAT